MTALDFLVFAVYMLCVLGIGYYHFRRNRSREDYYLGNRSMGAGHVGLSIVATDVGGGFSIGLGGLGFSIGLSGSWLLFAGLIGAWFSAVFIIPRIKAIDTKLGMFTYPDFLRHRYNGSVALIAALISGVGYLGFTGAQILAGAKLAAGTMFHEAPFGMDPLHFALALIATITIAYTVIGGLKAVIYTDTFQWIVLLSGLILVTIPVTLYKIGGLERLRTDLPPSHLSLTNITPIQFTNWMVTIVPIWLIGMTLYQRMYACRNAKEAKRAWYIAGVFEWPIMAFTGVFLGMCARVVFPDADPEMALPRLIRDILPMGVTGIVIAAYFSAIMSTADSCLMASSGNFVNDIIQRYIKTDLTDKGAIRLSMLATLIIGILALILAAQFDTVLDAILYAYAFMVAGLFIPTLGAFFWPRGSSVGALLGMLAGGLLTLGLLLERIPLPQFLAQTQLDPAAYGIALSLIVYVVGSLVWPNREQPTTTNDDAATTNTNNSNHTNTDKIETFHQATIQHGPLSQRIYLMKAPPEPCPQLVGKLNQLAHDNHYTKIFAKLPADQAEPFLTEGFHVEATSPHFFDSQDALFLAKFFGPQRAQLTNRDVIDATLELAHTKAKAHLPTLPEHLTINLCSPDDVEPMARLYGQVFASYPFPIHDPAYLLKTMQSHIVYAGLYNNTDLLALASAETDPVTRSVEMTDFATHPEHRRQSLALHLLGYLEDHMRRRNFQTAYTIARAVSLGMNITFARRHYTYAGTLINNTNIAGSIESMNVWYKHLK